VHTVTRQRNLDIVQVMICRNYEKCKEQSRFLNKSKIAFKKFFKNMFTVTSTEKKDVNLCFSLLTI